MENKKLIYLDYNATTPVDQSVMDAMIPYFTTMFGNASSDHFFGWDADEAVERSRASIATLVGCKSNEITFTSGATEAANISLYGFCEGNKDKGNHIITVSTEHNSVLKTMEALESKGFTVTYLNVDSEGNINIDELRDNITDRTFLVAIMLANNETGLLHPIKEIANIVHSKGVKLLCDITQAVGKIPVNLKELEIDLAFFSSHKIYGPKGVGALFINNGSQLTIKTVIFGGGQEGGLRSGTLNVPAIVGFGIAAEKAMEVMEDQMLRTAKTREYLESELKQIEGVTIISENSKRLPNTTNFSVENIDGTKLLRRLNTIAISRGSACHSNTVQPSHVLKAMGLTDNEALSSFRISLGRNTNFDEVEIAVKSIKESINSLQNVIV
ncbi:cysteine desulfurase family protein [Flavobacterium algicola]|uniref:cysteine desulfurase family protein n=1 Tax=Flavobacterium algicola TaxID=556529 RepID=UPI001EFCBB23|nr:cysteine desulfurase family protein [Flavobacterium algicola]MCG9793847.1 cysteine desulfurase [Flavobacterium algicola]